MAKKNLTIRIDDDLREQLQLIADAETRPLANQIIYYLTKAVDSYAHSNNVVFDTEQRTFRNINEFEDFVPF